MFFRDADEVKIEEVESRRLWLRCASKSFGFKLFFRLDLLLVVMDDDAETYKLWRIRKTIMQVGFVSKHSTIASCYCQWAIMDDINGDRLWENHVYFLSINITW